MGFSAALTEGFTKCSDQTLQALQPAVLVLGITAAAPAD